MRTIEPETRTTDEIVRDIVKKLEIPSIESLVRQRIAESRKLKKYPPLTGYKTDNKRFARELKKWADDGEKLFVGAPAASIKAMLFGPDGSFTTLHEIEAMQQQADARYYYLLGMLQTLRERCRLITQEEFGKDRRAGYQQERAAIAARELCELCGKPLAHTSYTSAYRTVASLLYEVMTGEHGRDLERACERIAHSPIWTDKSII